MNKDEIIEMPEYLNAAYEGDDLYTGDQVRELMKLVAEKEREACAKECWKQMGLLPTQAWTVNPYEQCINAIRERGQE